MTAPVEDVLLKWKGDFVSHDISSLIYVSCINRDTSYGTCLNSRGKLLFLIAKDRVLRLKNNNQLFF